MHVPTIVAAIYLGERLGAEVKTMLYGILSILVVIIAAGLVLKLWDEPLRNWIALRERRPVGQLAEPT